MKEQLREELANLNLYNNHCHANLLLGIVTDILLSAEIDITERIEELLNHGEEENPLVEYQNTVTRIAGSIKRHIKDLGGEAQR